MANLALMLSVTEENYLKAIFKLSTTDGESISTNEIAAEIQTTPASVSDMLKRLADKGFISYEKYRGVHLTPEGKALSIGLIRSHRLWEVFLVDKLGFKWDQIHVIAEELEHIKNPELIAKLDKYLGFPTHDPHGDPIPDAAGNIAYHEPISLHLLKTGDKAIVVGVNEQGTDFLQYLDKIKIGLGVQIGILDSNNYDHSKLVSIHSQKVFLSEKVCKNLVVKTI
ncbi:MAG: metal-dependent transcriptional regulator [Chitinophagales bacterium]|nr:metal-dependent transcriptional regulator [Chitinophagales bacterium]